MPKHVKSSEASEAKEVKMDDATEGFAVFKSMPNESFRFRVEKVQQQQTEGATGHGKIWLENKSSKKQWECEVKNIADFAPEGIAIPLETVLGYVASCLKSSATAAANSNFEADLVKNPKQNGEFVLEVTFKFDISGFSWSPTYKFPMKSVEVQEIDIFRSQLQDQREELESLKQRVVNLESRGGRFGYIN